MSVVEAFELIANSIAEINPAMVAQLKAPDAISQRVEELIEKKKAERITMEETTELDRYLALDLIINLTKAKAIKLLCMRTYILKLQR